MNNLLSKSLICGVIASSFLLINCQKAPNRPVKAGVEPLVKPQAAPMLACTPDMIKAIEGRNKLVAEIEKLISEDTQRRNNKSELDAASKELLQTKIDELADNSDALFDLIQKGGAKSADPKSADPKALPPQQGQVGGCNETDAKDSKKVTPHAIDAMKEKNEKLARITKSITGLTNKILEQIEKGYVQGKKVKLTADLAAMLSSKENLNGAKMIVDGKVAAGGAEYQKVAADASKTSCILTMADGEDVAADSIAELMQISGPERDAQSKRMKVNISLNLKKEGAAAAILNLSCNIAEGKDAASELSKALSALMPIAADQAPTPAPAPTPTPNPNPAPPASGDGSGPVSGDGSGAASGDGSDASGDGSAGNAGAQAASFTKAEKSDIARAMEIMRK